MSDSTIHVYTCKDVSDSTKHVSLHIFSISLTEYIYSVTLLSKSIAENNVPDCLIIGIDETNTQFVPSIKKTRRKRGTRRVRVIGIGHEKPQITVTFGATAEGHLVKPCLQLIFGGKTDKSHPNKGNCYCNLWLFVANSYDSTANNILSSPSQPYLLNERAYQI